MAETNKTLRLTQVKSAIGRKPNQGRTLRALGLHGIGSTTEQVDNEACAG
ncbi:MAG: 50S ribosomal protein L30 [Adlercreutzia equolifaciens]